ncbi:hypothetical protein [Streptomyces sp. DH37]|uniref:hypothetical protein n=1 Tax=Streptomyces sp. DH37 TaxID=3040122 RepID=UPI0024417EEA|nr:hypothetical protein [Streptomyces sp. DH37]MDG9705540.1 hypothetical protein [Streptomyces sp. DH37]
MTVRLGVDTNPLARGMRRATEALHGFHRDANGRLRDLRGRFVSEGDAAGAGFASGLLARARAGTERMAGIAQTIGGHPAFKGAGIASALSFVGAFAAIGTSLLGGLAVIKLSYQLLKDEPAVKKAAERLKKTAGNVFKTAAQPMAKPLEDAFKRVEKTVKDLQPDIEKMFKNVADSGALKSLTDGLDKFAKNTMPGLNKMLEKVGPVFEGLETMLGKIGSGLSSFFDSMGGSAPDLKVLLSDIGSLLQGILWWAGKFFGFWAKVYAIVRTGVSKVIEAFKWLYEQVAGEGGAVRRMVTRVVGWITGLPGRVMGTITGFVQRMRAKWTSLGSDTRERTKNLVIGVVEWLRSLPGRAWSALSTFAGKLRDRATEGGRKMLSAAKTKAGELLAYIRGLPGRAKDALGSIGSRLYSSGRALISGFVNGIKSKVQQVRDAAAGVVDAARQYFPFSPAKEGPFSGKGWTAYSGASLIDGFAEGVARRAPFLRKQVGAALSGLPNAAVDVSPPGVARAEMRRETRLVVDVTGGDEDLVRLLRKWIKRNGRNDVQFALSG